MSASPRRIFPALRTPAAPCTPASFSGTPPAVALDVAAASHGVCLTLRLRPRAAHDAAEPCESAAAWGRHPDDFEVRAVTHAAGERIVDDAAFARAAAPGSDGANAYVARLPTAWLCKRVRCNSTAGCLTSIGVRALVFSTADYGLLEPPCSITADIAERTTAVAAFSLLCPASPLPSAAPAPPLALARCRDTFALPARWVDARAPGALGPSRDGRWWSVDGCAFTPLTGAGVVRAFAATFPRGSTVLLLGDSNMQRSYATLVGYTLPEAAAETASAWCSRQRDDIACACGGESTLGMHAGSSRGDTDFGGVRVAFRWMPGVHPVNPNDLPEWRAGVMEEGLGDVRAVVFTLAHWEVAFGTFSFFRAEVWAFAAALASAFPNATSFFFQTPNYIVAEYRLHHHDTHARNALFVGEALAALRYELGARLVVVEARAMHAARPIDAYLAHVAECRAANASYHAASEDADVTAQVLFHAMLDTSGGR